MQTLYSLISIAIYFLALYFYDEIKTKHCTLLNKIILCILILCLILSISSLFFLKKMQIQLLLNKINIAMNIINSITILVFSSFYYYRLNISIFYQRKMYIFFIIFLSISILKKTNKLIKKDIKLIESINRIR